MSSPILSVIVPTMWRSSYFKITLSQIKNLAQYSELIIIDNDSKNRRMDWDFDSPNIKILEQSTNIGVNQAWNLGVMEAQSRWILVLNDDVGVNLANIILNIDRNSIPEGLWGLPNSFFNNDLDFKNYYQLHFAYPLEYRPVGFGQCMLLLKENWYPIPDGLKIYMGDDIQWQRHYQLGKRPGTFLNLQVVGEVSKTSSDSKWSLNHPDAKFYWEWHKEHGFGWPFPSIIN